MRRQFVCMIGMLATQLGTGGCIPKDAPGETPASAAALKPCPRTAMIEDAEDNDNQVVVQEGRAGYVYTYVDKVGSTISPNSDTGAFAMTPGGAENSKYAIRMSGKIGAGDVVYAGTGINFLDPKGPYDASRYEGITFWAKAAPGSTGKVRVKLPDTNTDPSGGVCSECFNDFGYDLDLTNEWKQYTIPFAEMSQDPSWGSPHPSEIDKSKIYGVQFQVNDKGADYDVWIDNLAFVGCS